MAPASLDLSLDEAGVIKASRSEPKGRGKGRKEHVAPKEEEMVGLDMSLDELIEKEAQPQKGKKNWQEEWEKPGKEKEWGPNKWQDKTKSTGTWKASWKDNDQSGGGGSWKASWKSADASENWKKADSWKAAEQWKPKAEKWEKDNSWSSGKKNDWSGHQEEWKPKPRGDEWSANSWGAQPKSQAWEKWPQDKWEAPVRQTWRPTNEQERWNSRNEVHLQRWERPDTSRQEAYGRQADVYGRPAPDYGRGQNDYARQQHDYARQGHDYGRGTQDSGRQGPAEGYGRAFDVRDRRGRERSRSPPRRNFYEEPPARGSIILVKNIPLGLDSRDIRDAFQSATGPVTSCKLSQDGTARISFERPEDAKKAVATFDHGELNGNIINVHIIN
ncbi:Uncharacterized protein SCF082_LOCUS28321 [Durusdinium trenchii]|uniref:RRM domain-containing protein n=1 Tax=Durusdinium trenchii TaxID=1381693 RepID=A0ABP0MNB7_9DINO